MAEPARALLLAPLLAGAFALLYAGGFTLLQDIRFNALQREISFWPRGNYHPTQATRQRTDEGLRQLLAASPAQPTYLELRANQQAWEAYWSDETEAKRRHRGQAVEHQLAALRERPAYRQGWKNLLQYGASGPAHTELRALAEARLILLEPRE